MISDAEVTLDGAIAHEVHGPEIADPDVAGSDSDVHDKVHDSVAHAISAPFPHQTVYAPVPIVHDHSNTAVNNDEKLHGADAVYGFSSVTFSHGHTLLKYHSNECDDFAVDVTLVTGWI